MAATRTRKSTAAANHDEVAAATARVLDGESTFEQEAAAMLAPKPRQSRPARNAAKAAQTAPAAPAPEARVVAPTQTFKEAAAEIVETTVAAPEKPAKAPRVRKSLIPVEGCSLVDQNGTVQPCADHKTYASDPHCRNRECPNSIQNCQVHVLVKGGRVEIAQPTPVQQPQSRAWRTHLERVVQERVAFALALRTR